ncbi:MAG: hypothetical protein A2X85_03650 [Geobacteraceae bacterium GWF2_54_21]|nr:MAG: hypothetical protein A2X85_03650 [Geobacteraceae bacterium GWF2_54_21]
MSIRNRVMALLSMLVFALTASNALADNYSFTGNFNRDNDVQLFNFTVGADTTVTLRTWSYAGGTNAAGNLVASGGFDPILALFNSSGLFIDDNDDGGSFVPADAASGARYDTFLTSFLHAGTYTVAISQYDNFANGPYLSDGFVRDGVANEWFREHYLDTSGLYRDSHWAFDIENVQAASPVPEPSTLILLAAGLASLGYIRRRSSK